MPKAANDFFLKENYQLRVNEIQQHLFHSLATVFKVIIIIQDCQVSAKYPVQLHLKNHKNTWKPTQVRHEISLLCFWCTTFFPHSHPLSTLPICNISYNRNGSVHPRYNVCANTAFCGILLDFAVRSWWLFNIFNPAQSGNPAITCPVCCSSIEHRAEWFLPQGAAISASCSFHLWQLGTVISVWKVSGAVKHAATQPCNIRKVIKSTAHLLTSVK